MDKVLIISSPFFDYQKSVGRAFEELGYEVRIETYDEPIHPFKGLLRWRHKLASQARKEVLRQRSRERYDTYIRSVFEEFTPDIVFSYNGTILLDATLDWFRQRSKVILWMYDSVLRKDREMCRNHIDHADAVFCFEKKDVDYYDSIGKKAFFLPLACDTTIYYPPENPLGWDEKEIDILFVGTIYTSPHRAKILKEIVSHYPDRKIVVYGHYKPYFKNPIKWFFREKRNIFKNRNILPEEVNALFARTKIALNIHHKQTSFGANQRVFEASGAGAYQICDRNPFIESLFPNGEAGLYRNEEELFALIDDALANDKSDCALKGYNIIISSHTFKVRVEEMLRTIGVK